MERSDMTKESQDTALTYVKLTIHNLPLSALKENTQHAF